MKSCKKLAVEPYTQWEPEVSAASSACGPSTMAALLEYWRTRQGHGFIQGWSHFNSKAAHINYIYRHHGGTPWGMSVRSFKRGIEAYIGAAFNSEEAPRHKLSLRTFNDFDQYKAEIDAGRPVAIKFDKWFSFHWKGSFTYDYHWVIGTGYEHAVDSQEATLIILDNGGKVPGSFIPSRERRVDYVLNKDILTMVALNIEKM